MIVQELADVEQMAQLHVTVIDHATNTQSEKKEEVVTSSKGKENTRKEWNSAKLKRNKKSKDFTTTIKGNITTWWEIISFMLL